MPNNFSALTEKTSSKKFYMGTIEGKIWVNPLIEDVGDETYKCNLAGYDIISGVVTASQTALARVDALPLGDNEYFFDRDSGDLYMRKDSTVFSSQTVDPKDSDDFFVFTFVIAFTNDSERINYYNLDELSPADHKKVVYQGRLAGSPAFGSSLDQALYGFVTVSRSNIELQNLDSYYNKYFKREATFKNAKVTIWRCIDSEENRSIAFLGFVSAATIGRNLSFAVDDILRIFDKTLYTVDYDFSKSTFGGYYGAASQESSAADPIRELYGFVTPFGVKYDTLPSSNIVAQLNPDTLLRAGNVNYNATPTTSNNRLWATIKKPATGHAEFSHVLTVAPVIVGLGGGIQAYLIDVGVGNHTRFSQGDHVRITKNGGGGTYYGVVQLVSTNAIRVYPDIATWTLGIGDTLYLSPIRAVIVRQNSIDYYLFPFRDYTVQLDGAGKVVEFLLVNNFEATFSGMATLNPETDSVFYKYGRDVPYKHYDVVEDIFTNVLGYAVDTTQAQTDSLNVSFIYPGLGTTSFQKTRDVLQQVLISSYGYIALTSEYEFTYRVFEEPVTGSEVLDDDDFLDESIQTTYDYLNSYTQIQFRNPQYPFNLYNGTYDVDFPLNRIMEGTDTRLLYENFMDVVYGDQSVLKFGKIARFLAWQKASVEFRTKTRNFETDNGEELTLSSVKMPESSELITIVLSVDKTDSASKVVVSDLQRNKSLSYRYVNGRFVQTLPDL